LKIFLVLIKPLFSSRVKETENNKTG